MMVGDAQEKLREIPDESVHCCTTSPPYWGLRSYGGDPGMIGLEPTFDEHLANLVAVFREVRRVLRKDGTLWLNYGDAYASTPSGTNLKTLGKVYDGGTPWRDKRTFSTVQDGLKPKDLMMMPARVAIALQEDGWWLRSEIVWHKCLSGGAWLYAETQKGVGPHMLKDLARLDPSTVRLWNGKNWTRVVAWSQSPSPRGRPLEIVLRSGERIGCTPNHRWPTQRGLVETQELRAGDVIASCKLPFSGSGGHPPWLHDDALWFAGLYLAEGSMSGETIQLSGHTKERVRWQRIEELCDYYGASPRLYENGNIQNIHIDQAAALHAVLKTIVSGRTAKDKHLNLRVWSWGNRAIRRIIDGYLEGDGSDEGARVRLGFTRNYHLERDLRCAAARLGATITIKPTVASIGPKDYPAFRGEWRWERSGHHSEKDRAEVIEVRRSRARKFWDVSVADDPHLFALASGVLTHNSNPMPESCTDRPTSSHEKLFLLTKSARYFYDAEAVRTANTEGTLARFGSDGSPNFRNGRFEGGDRPETVFSGKGANPGVSGANLRNVWTIATHSFKEAHFATFPPALVEPCIKAGTSAKGVCGECGAPWVRNTSKKVEHTSGSGRGGRQPKGKHEGSEQAESGTYDIRMGPVVHTETTGWSPSCACNAAVVPAIVLDPFAGSGTVGLVASRLQRDAVLIEINKEYADMALRRIDEDEGMFKEEAR